jgi:hypothetical protein
MAAKRKPKPPPRLTPAQREKRDNLILDLFLAGHSQRDIAANAQVKLSHYHVGRIIRTELERATKDHILRNENAMIILLARMESLVRKALEHVETGDLKAIEVARRLLREQIDVYGLADVVRAPIPPMNDNDIEVDGPQLDELARYRQQREKLG